MLTSDLVQARLYKKKVRPRYVNPRDPDLLEMARRLIDTFGEHVGKRRGELDVELKEVLGNDTDFQLHKALAKLLLDRCLFEEVSPLEPEMLRETVFDLAAEAWRANRRPADAGEESPRDDEEIDFRRHRFDRNGVLGKAAEVLRSQVDGSVDSQVVEAGLYADLKHEQVLQEWQRCRADWLLHRYNVALAQGVLLRATEMEIRLGEASVAKHRALFRKIKFFQLMHRIRRAPDGGWRIVLDGPASLFQSSSKYGLQMASFLPTLLHFEDWSVEAQVSWGPRRRRATFELDPSHGLRSHTKLTGQWQPEELRWLPKQLAELETDWQVSTDGDLLNLGGEGVLVPDYVFTHGPSGTQVFMEVFGFWNRGAIDRRLRLLGRHGPKNLILAVSSQLATSKEGLDDAGAEIYIFRTHPIARKVLKRLEAQLES
ncbi:MAG: DUF790 family protein [Thermoanaerobaculia bacterium]|nr:DUF790 family protein [Thermoanaerobaculia bacterium]